MSKDLVRSKLNLFLSLMRTFSSPSADGQLSSEKRDKRVSENILVQQFTPLLKIIMLRTGCYLLPGRGGVGILVLLRLNLPDPP